MARELASGILVGIGIGLYIPDLPPAISSLSLYLGLILIIVGIVLLVNSKN